MQPQGHNKFNLAMHEHKALVKGQTKSKWFFEADDSSEKQTNEIVFLA